MIGETKWKIFNTNDEAWASILDDCRKAEKSIVLEQFIFTTDEFGTKLIDVCRERASHGVKIRFLWDAAGSFTFWGSGITKELKKSGIDLRFWKTLIPGYYKIVDFRSWFLRNHRRTLVVDEKVGYTGSICVSDQMKNWRDINIRLEGSIAKEMQSAFERMWARSTSTRPLPRRITSDDPEFRYLRNYPAPGHRHVYSSLVHAVRHAEKYIFITTPYFVPTHKLAHALKIAAKRGVDVRIILPQESDHYAVDLGARSFFHTLLEHGVRIFLYQGNMIHSKATVIDDTWASVGTMNLDQISLLYNFEANINTTNVQFCQELAGHFIKDMALSREVMADEWRNRFFLEKIPEILIKLVRKFL